VWVIFGLAILAAVGTVLGLLYGLLRHAG